MKKIVFSIIAIASLLWSACNDAPKPTNTPRMNLQAQIGEAEVLFEQKIQVEEMTDQSYEDMVTMYKTYITAYGDDSLSDSYAVKAGKLANMHNRPEDAHSFCALFKGGSEKSKLGGQKELIETIANFQETQDTVVFQSRLNDISLSFRKFDLGKDISQARLMLKKGSEK